MLANYFIMAWRHLRKDKVFSLINVFGLALSIAACLLIFQYAFFELRYDQYHKNARNLYRIATSEYENGQKIAQRASSPMFIGLELKEKFTEVVQSARLLSTRGWFDCTLKYDDPQGVKIFNEHHLFFTGPSFLSMFTYRGVSESALDRPFSIVLSRSVAAKYFGEKDPIGKILFLQGSSEQNNYTVTGVMDDPRFDSHIDADILLSISSLDHNTHFKKFFKNYETYTYLQLASESGCEDLKDKLLTFTSTFLKNEAGGKEQLSIHPITSIHLYQNLEDEIKPHGSAKTVYFLLLVAVVILLIAWINYINSTTARSLARAKEVGIRKVSGATRLQLSYQFLTEALIVNVFSVLISMILVYLFAPQFYQLTGLATSQAVIFDPGTAIVGYFLVAVFFIGVCLTGLYPSRILSSYNPSMVLTGKFLRSESGLILRKVLIVFQFGCSIGLTTIILVFAQQYRHMQNMELGIDIGKTIVVKAPANVDSTYQMKLSSLKSRLKDLSSIRAVTSSSVIPGDNMGWTGPVRRENDKSSGREFVIDIVDPDFLDSYKLKLLTGRNFLTNDFPIMNHFGAKLEPVILNNLAISQLGYLKPEDAVNTIIFWNENKCRVIGVIDDFHQSSPKYSLQPTLFTANNGPNISLKLESTVGASNLSETVSIIRKTWNSVFPDNTFDYFFLDDFISNQYLSDKQLINLFNFFCWLAIIISSLGLFGLSSFTVSQRTKEVSIRKILGASSLKLIELLMKEFLLLIIIASCIALPFSYLGIDQWLRGFAFHIDLSIIYFVIPVLVILLIAFLTISVQTFKAINSDPAQTLKHE